MWGGTLWCVGVASTGQVVALPVRALPREASLFPLKSERFSPDLAAGGTSPSAAHRG